MTTVEIQIPDAVEEALLASVGPNLRQAVKEELAVAWYRAQRLSIGQVAQFLGATIYEAEGLLKRHGVPSHYSEEDLQRDRETLAKLTP